MKKLALYIVLIVAIFATSGMTAEADVDRVSIERIGNETVCKIWVGGPFQYTHEIPENISGKPYRVVVDIFPAVHKLGNKEFTNLPSSIVTSIRSSQFAVSPEKVVRIVLDLKDTAPYRIEKKQGQIWVFLPDKNSKPFPQWTSWIKSKNTTPDKIVPKTTKSKTEPEMTKNKPALMGKEVAQKQAEPTVKKENKSVEQAKQIKAEVIPQSVATYHLAKKSSFKDWDRAQTEKWSSTPPNQTLAVLANNTNSEQKAKSESPTTENQPVKKSQSKDKSEKKAEPAKTKKKEKDEPFKKSRPVTADKPENSGKPAVASTEPAEQKASESEKADKKPTSRFRRKPNIPAKLKGTIVAQFPTRMVIKYKPGIIRDPFKTLIDETKKTDSQRQKKTPDIETLRLVGVIEAANGQNRALLEDIDGFGYIMSEGDKVKKGYVSRIDSKKAYFQLYEYGWSRTVALHLGTE